MGSRAARYALGVLRSRLEELVTLLSGAPLERRAEHVKAAELTLHPCPGTSDGLALALELLGRPLLELDGEGELA